MLRKVCIFTCIGLTVFSYTISAQNKASEKSGTNQSTVNIHIQNNQEADKISDKQVSSPAIFNTSPYPTEQEKTKQPKPWNYNPDKVLAACPVGAFVENEPNCYTDYVDIHNGGCNSIPEVFQYLPSNCNHFVCGKTGTFTVGGSDNRDTDWFQFTTTDSTTVFVDAVADFDMYVFIVDGTLGCASYYLYAQADALAGDTASISCIVGPGTWWIWIGAQVFTGIPCGTDYQFNFYTVQTPTPTALENPSCTGATELVAIPSTNFVDYYWQGTVCGNSTANPANINYPIYTPDTYYLTGYNAGTGCWSANCSSIDIELFNFEPVTSANGFSPYAEVCISEQALLDVDSIDHVVYRWRRGATILRDWDINPEYTEMAPTDGFYVVDMKSPFMPKTLLLYAQDGNFGLQSYLQTDGRCGQVDIFDARDATPSPTTIMEYTTIITWTDDSYQYPDSIGNMLVDYVDNGGSVLVLAFGMLAGGSNWGVLGDFLSMDYCPIEQNDNYTNSSTAIGTISNPTHEILQSISDVTAGYHIVSSVLNTGASPIFYWGDGSLGLAEKHFPSGGTVVALNSWPGDISGADGMKLIANSTAYLYTYFPCEISDSVEVIIIDVPNAAGTISGNTTVCEYNTGVVYSVPLITDATTYDWNYSGTGATINGNGNSITIDFTTGATSGTLSVAGENLCGTGTQSTLNVVVDPCLSINESSSLFEIEVNPNPSQGEFTIEFYSIDNSDYNLSITNVLGQIVYSKTIHAVSGINKSSVDLSTQTAGNYTLHLSGISKLSVKKIVITE